MAESIFIRGNGGAIFEVDPDNPAIAAQIKSKTVVVIEKPDSEEKPGDRIAEGIAALKGDPTDAAEWLAGARPREATEVLAQSGESHLELAEVLRAFEEQGKARKTMLAALEGYIKQATEPPVVGQDEIPPDDESVEEG